MRMKTKHNQAGRQYKNNLDCRIVFPHPLSPRLSSALIPDFPLPSGYTGDGLRPLMDDKASHDLIVVGCAPPPQEVASRTVSLWVLSGPSLCWPLSVSGLPLQPGPGLLWRLIHL